KSFSTPPSEILLRFSCCATSLLSMSYSSRFRRSSGGVGFSALRGVPVQLLERGRRPVGVCASSVVHGDQALPSGLAAAGAGAIVITQHLDEEVVAAGDAHQARPMSASPRTRRPPAPRDNPPCSGSTERR